MKIMQTKQTKPAAQRAARSRYRIVNHQEAGVFDSMTGAMLWALKNLDGWNWQIEPVTSAQADRKRKRQSGSAK